MREEKNSTQYLQKYFDLVLFRIGGSLALSNTKKLGLGCARSPQIPEHCRDRDRGCPKLHNPNAGKIVFSFGIYAK